ncbi:hypothetical protein FXO37_01216 [Capsicum annuum]|nr:hypothetical protein FXO37_01216 [Capsicum annuum]
MLNLFLFQQFNSAIPIDTHALFFSFMIIVRVHAYDKESCTLLVPSMMSSQFVQQSESLFLPSAIIVRRAEVPGPNQWDNAMVPHRGDPKNPVRQFLVSHHDSGTSRSDRVVRPGLHGLGCPSWLGPSLDCYKLGIRAWFMVPGFMIIVRVHAYDKESCTLLVPSMMSSQFIQQSKSLSSFCNLAITLRPALMSYMKFMDQYDPTASKDMNNDLSVAEKVIQDACNISCALDASRDVPSIKKWLISKVSVLLLDSNKEACSLLSSSVTEGVWSLIEKSLELPTAEIEGISKSDLVTLEKHVVYSLTK